MKLTRHACQRGTLFTALAWLASGFFPPQCHAFEGRITAIMTRGGETQSFLYTVGMNVLRLQRGETNRPHAVNLVERGTSGVTLLFPHNRSFVRLKPQSEISSAPPPRFPAMPRMPDGIGPQTPPSAALPAPAHTGPTNIPGLPDLPRKPALPADLPPGIEPQSGTSVSPVSLGLAGTPVMMEKIELTATGDKTNLLGYLCEKYQIQQRGEVMEMWATDKLLPFQPYLQDQPHRFGPRMIEEQWGDLLKAKKLFPLLAILRFEQPASPGGATPSVAGPERLRFEVKSVMPEKIEDKTGALFQPPADYHEVEPLPF